METTDVTLCENGALSSQGNNQSVPDLSKRNLNSVMTEETNSVMVNAFAQLALITMQRKIWEMKQRHLKMLYEVQQKKQRTRQNSGSCSSLPSSSSCSSRASFLPATEHLSFSKKTTENEMKKLCQIRASVEPAEGAELGSSPTSSGSSSAKLSPPDFLEKDNYYLLECEDMDYDMEDVEEPEGSSSEAGSNDSPEEEDARLLFTQTEFMRIFGMIPRDDLPALLDTRALRAQHNKRRLFFSSCTNSKYSKRDAKRKKKPEASSDVVFKDYSEYVQTPLELSADGTVTVATSYPVSPDFTSRPTTPSSAPSSRAVSPELSSDGPSATGPSVEAPLAAPRLCSHCSSPESPEDPVWQCGGCGCHYHQLCAPSDPVTSVGGKASTLCVWNDPWLCGSCRGRGMRAPILHDPLLLRNLKFNAAPLNPWGNKSTKKDNSKNKKSYIKPNYNGNAEKKSKIAEPPKKPASVPVTSTNTIKTRGSANRRPPAKLMSPTPSARQQRSQLSRSLKATSQGPPPSQLTLSTKSIKLVKVQCVTSAKTGGKTSTVTGKTEACLSANRIDTKRVSASKTMDVPECLNLEPPEALKIGKSRINLTKVTAAKVSTAPSTAALSKSKKCPKIVNAGAVIKTKCVTDKLSTRKKSSKGSTFSNIIKKLLKESKH